MMDRKQRQEMHGTKYGLHPALPVILVYLGSCIASVVFGMVLFSALADICANVLLYGMSKVGYGAILVVLVGVGLEAYHLYEFHKRHVAWTLLIAFGMAMIAIWLLYFLTQQFTC